MRLIYAVSLLATFAPIASSQQLVPTAGSSTFPACAVSCPILDQAQTVCTPPNAITSNQQTYTDCFCQAPYLADLYTTGETLCTSQCTATADRQLLSTWFINTCAAVGDTYGGKTTATTLSTSTVSGTSTQTSAASTSTGSSSSSSTSSTASNSGPWIKSHWQYIIMLIVLGFGLLAIGLGARYWKKRHDQKVEQTKATKYGFPMTGNEEGDRDHGLSPEPWGAHQHMTESKGHQYTPNTTLPIIDEDSGSGRGSNEKGKRLSRVEVTEIEPVPIPVHSKSPRP